MIFLRAFVAIARRKRGAPSIWAAGLCFCAPVSFSAETAALRGRSFDCVVIGAGLREPTERLLLFEMILNLVHALAPEARICFNRNPADTLDAVRRWMEA